MFINYFKSSFFNQYLAVFLTGLALWTGNFIHPVALPMPEGPVPFYRLLYNLFRDHAGIAGILGFLLVSFETYFLNYIFNRHELIPKNSSFSALVFIVVMSSYPGFLTLNPVNISLVFILFMLHHLLIYYNKPEHLDRVYISGFFTTIASLFYFPMTIWFIFVTGSLILCRAAGWRAWFAVIAGFITPFLYILVYLFWNDELIETMQNFRVFCSAIRMTEFRLPINFLIPGIFTLLLFSWTLFTPMTDSDKAVETRTKMNVVIWSFIFAIFSWFLSQNYILLHFILTFPLISLVMARKIQGKRKHRGFEIVFLCYFLVILANNLFPVFTNLVSVNP